jgi:glycerol transport system ATP-binding protein
MTVQLVEVSYRSGSQLWLHPLDLPLVPGAMNLLLGATLAGKTTVLRLLAGLDRPATGRVISKGHDVTGMSVRRRNLAMVYQQFINYPSLTVYENIASPLRLARHTDADIRKRVESVAETLRLTAYLDRYPAQLSGGQQQRTALARALVKDAELVLLDEPLVNLDYKLREELREELSQLFLARGTTVVYATTEPQEALQLGGYCAILSEGRLVQHGRTLDLFRRPATIEGARAFSDPPLNEIPASYDQDSNSAILDDGVRLPLPPQAVGRMSNRSDRIVIGVRAHHFEAHPPSRHSGSITGRVDLAEISGSDTYVHVSRQGLSLTAQISGVRDVALGEPFTLHVDAHKLYCFDTGGRLLFAPQSSA